MLPSSTVENYLKAIYLGVHGLPEGQRLLAMGQLAAALGIAPGTATTMVKTLADAGLAEYEPYTGVTLTPAGERLAALVLRRHRLIELFLVKVMGFRWDEVHEEAEQLEHAVSDRLIDRIDEMLGRPEADPHGDPIPNAEGAVKPQDLQSLLTCPLRTRVTVTRVVDQDKTFLRFIESNNLKPGESIEVEERDPASDSVSVKGKGDRRITIGTRAASKLLVQTAGALLLIMSLATSARAQAPVAANPQDSSRPFEILDNSFLVEEAFNQEGRIFQNIFNVRVARGGDWESTFTQEWPVFGQTHQFSYTIPFSGLSTGHGVGNVFLNYRLQVSTEEGGGPAFSPRLSLILPSASGSVSKGIGDGDVGWQVNLPFSRQAGDLYVHWSAGFTQTPRAAFGDTTRNLFSPQAAGSLIYRLRPMFNLMLEAVAEWEAQADQAGTARSRTVTVSPGFRTGWNTGDVQTIIGAALPIAVSEGNTTDVGVFGYFSVELPFVRKKP